MENILYLGSKSQARRQLLEDAQINFTTVPQDADETQCAVSCSLKQTVETIALYKMEHVILPSLRHGTKVPAQDERDIGETCFVLTADTLTQNSDGCLCGKPKDRADAIKMIKSARKGAQVGTAFCVDRRVWRDDHWKVFKRIQGYAIGQYELNIPDEWVDIYLDKSFSASSSGAIAIEVYGAQFLKTVNGSHSAIVGLPMFEVREALEEVGFFAFL